MADANAQRLVIKITGDTSELESRLAKLKSTADGILRAGAGSVKPSVLAAEQRRMAAEARANAQIETAASKERIASTALEIQQAKLLLAQQRESAKTRTIAGLSPESVKALDDLSMRMSGLRRESKAAGMDIYRNIGNPFLIISSLSQRITGIYQLQRDLEGAQMRLEGINDQLQVAKRNGDQVSVDRLTKEANQAATAVEGLSKRMTGAGTKLRGFADFFVNQFMTAGLFAIFQLNTLLIQGLATAGMSMVRSLVDPLGVAKERAKELASLVEKFGGTKKLALALDLSEEDRKTLEAAVRISESQTAFERRIGVERGLTETAGITPGGYTEDEIKRLRMEAALRAIGSKGFEADLLRFLGWDFTFGAGAQPGQVGNAGYAAGMSVTKQKLDRQAQLDYARQLVEVAREGGALDDEQRRTIEQIYGLEGKRLLNAYDLIQAEKARTTELQRQQDQLERERYRLTGSTEGLGTGEGAKADKWFMREVAASRRIEQLQRALNSFSDKITRRQRAQQLGQAQAEVVRAGVGRPGQTGFELAAAVMEARERARETREQVQIQRRQENIQKRIEYWNSVQANAKRQQDILANAMAIGLSKAQMVLTVDPKSGQLLARFVANDVYQLLSGASTNNVPNPAPVRGGRIAT